ncbi:MAG TPA: hypothetical protein PLD20_01845 [Blastocatellia bacterium]|nr:hypothetical protein [Blastocatellia bacterium]HNG33870.1 hypothetical protein [Blastocatellia bacterium]
MAKNKVITQATAESRFQAAIRAAETLRDDQDLADEIEDEGVEGWAERKGYTIENPRKKGGKRAMPSRTSNSALRQELEELREENEELRATLADIKRLSNVDEEDDDEDEFDDEDEEDDYEEDEA